MKTIAVYLKYLGTLTVFFAVAISCFGIDALPQRPEGFDIDLNICNEANKLPTVELRCEYLSAVATNTPGLYSTNNFKVASAIRLLALIHSTNLIPALAYRIDFADDKYHDAPAMPALISFGDAAVPQLLEVVKQPRWPDRARNAVEALVAIKGSNYLEFVEAQKSLLPPEAWKRLSWHAFHYELPAITANDTLPHQLRSYEIDTNLCNEANPLPTLEQRSQYLASVITNTKDSTPEDNFRIASAIRLLEVIHCTNSTVAIAALASRIDFRDVKYRNYPALSALAAMGEAAVPQLLEIVKEATPSGRIGRANEVLVEIKGSKWLEFVYEQENILPREIWRRLFHVVRYE